MSKVSLELLQPKRVGFIDKLRKHRRPKTDPGKVITIAPVWAKVEASKNEPRKVTLGVK